ncbi:MAG: hypothetical protein BAJALOKI1v1_1290007 [Promethearchaeota archaeon]|nr:MAG: hypothetical protein BAJALOKI1v1_1290007 [Candidatus Lokiarchaeota archaeon]
MAYNSINYNLWYLNINSNSGVAIGKCGHVGSNLTDLDITAGLITASQQLNNEMVNNNETSKYHVEEIKGGAKRVILYSTWANELQNPELSFSPPIITSMLQVSGPEMEKGLQNKILLFLKDLNDQIIFRFLLGELIPERTIEPIIHVDILNHLIKKYNEDQKGLLNGTSQNLEELIKNHLLEILDEDPKILTSLLSKIPLESTFFQQKYVRKIKQLKKFIKDEIREFLTIEYFLTRLRQEKVYGENNSFKEIKQHYNVYLDKQETFLQNRNALKVALERSILTIEDLAIRINKISNKKVFKLFFDLKQILPQMSDIEIFIKKMVSELKGNTDLQILEAIKERCEFKGIDINRALIEEGIIPKEDAKESYKKIKELQSNLQSIISLAQKLTESDTKETLDRLQEMFVQLLREKPNFNFQEEKEKIKSHLFSSLIGQSGLKDLIKEYSSYKSYQEFTKRKIKKLRQNIVTKIIDSLFSKIFHSFNHFKYVVSYPKEFKHLIIKGTIDSLTRFLYKIQDFSFASLMDRILSQIKSTNLIKYYSSRLLRSFLANFLLENILEHPFIIRDKNPVIAFDTYSLKFCSEVIKNSGLNEDIYEIIDKMVLPEEIKESFVQIMDTSGLTTEDIINELKHSRNTIISWLDKIEKSTNKLSRVKKNITSQHLIDLSLEFIKENRDNKDKQLEKGIYFIKEQILKNLKEGSKDFIQLQELYTDKNEVRALREKLKEIEKDATTIFGGKRPYNKFISIINSLLSDHFTKAKEEIAEILKELDYLVDTNKTDNVKKVLNKLENFRKLIEDSEEVKELELKLSKMFEYERFKALYTKLNTLDNQFLKLEKYPHIRGLLKTASSSEPIFGKSRIEYKYESYNLLLEALIEIYAIIYEDYFGKFSFEDTKGIIFSDLKVSINLGKIFNYQYKLAKELYQFQIGLDQFKHFLKTSQDYSHKFDLINFSFILNFLPNFMKKREYNSFELWEFFTTQEHLHSFFEYILDYYSQPAKIKELKEMTRKVYEETLDYVNGSSKKPIIPDELRVLKNDQLDILFRIIENAKKNDKSFYRKGNHSDKSHPSNEYNFSSISMKKLEKFIEQIDEIRDILQDDIDYLFKKLSYEAAELKPLDEIIEEIHDDLKDEIKREVEKYSLSEYDFEDINKIRIMSYLNPIRYELPLDIKLYLINEGRYNRKTMEGVIKGSTRISDAFKFIVNGALLKDPLLKKILKIRVKMPKDDKIMFPYTLEVPQEISQRNKLEIFGKSAVWDPRDQNLLLGFELSTNEDNINICEQIIKADINQKISKELRPLMNILNRYSEEIHTGFTTVYKKLFE